jgi:hypothetical protein
VDDARLTSMSDAARSVTPGQKHIMYQATVQFLRFRVTQELETSLLALRQEFPEDCQANNPGLQVALLVRLEDGDWLDITVWVDSAADGSGRGPYPSVLAAAEFFSKVEGLLGDETRALVASYIGSSLLGVRGRGNTRLQPPIHTKGKELQCPQASGS